DPRRLYRFKKINVLLVTLSCQQLLELQDVLQKLQSKRLSRWEIKLNQVPKCIMREPCALKRGARIGKLCECPPSTNCNFFFLKCL
uniref:Cocaine- and amphetamine-regulated transcript protein n=1 Tax=Leptobrachium leishanense TaxID=445787 RepID=A0A8C5PWN0_9ANUR